MSGKAEEVKRWYDGYHFGRFDVYCPWDVMNYMRDLQQNPEAAPASRKRNKNKKMQGNCQLYNSYLHLSFRSIIYKKLPIASHFYIHVTSAAEKASALFYPLSHTRMDK